MHTISNIKMVVTDLDGTLLNDQGEVSKKDLETLESLKTKGVIRVIATGRSPFSYSRVLPDNFPIDYLIFSSGAGAFNQQDKSLIYTTELKPAEIQPVIEELMKHEVDFMLHEPIPSNHRFLFHRTGGENPDFERRLAVYRPFCQPFAPGVAYESAAAQIIAILPNDVEWFEQLKGCFPELKVIRATSPLDGHSIWMEIFSSNVSKAFGIEQIANLHQIKKEQIITIGNDYNDVDMLEHYPNSFVVSNAPEDLRNKYQVVSSNNESGFSQAVHTALLKNG